MFTPPIFFNSTKFSNPHHPHPHLLRLIPQQTLSPSPSSDPSDPSDWSFTPTPTAPATPRLPHDADLHRQHPFSHIPQSPPSPQSSLRNFNALDCRRSPWHITTVDYLRRILKPHKKEGAIKNRTLLK